LKSPPSHGKRRRRRKAGLDWKREKKGGRKEGLDLRFPLTIPIAHFETLTRSVFDVDGDADSDVDVVGGGVAGNGSAPFFEVWNGKTSEAKTPLTQLHLSFYRQKWFVIPFCRRSRVFVSELVLRRLSFDDTGTFVCAYNGTVDTADSIDNATKVHLFVEDAAHPLKQTGLEFFHFVQSSKAVLPCLPTSPEVNVTLVRVDGGGGQTVNVGRSGVSFDPTVREFSPLENDSLSCLRKSV